MNDHDLYVKLSQERAIGFERRTMLKCLLVLDPNEIITDSLALDSVPPWRSYNTGKDNEWDLDRMDKLIENVKTKMAELRIGVTPLVPGVSGGVSAVMRELSSPGKTCV